MICIQCGSYNPDNAAFCGKCGGPLKHASSTPPYLSAEGAPASVSAQSPTQEYISTVQDMPIGSSFPQSQGTPPSRTREPWYKALSKPIPIWILIGSIVLVAILLIVLQLTGSDWAAGAMRVGVIAGILALVILLITVVRILLGMAAKSNPSRMIQLIGAGVAILLLSLLCLVGLTQQSTIHSLQGHSWEGQQQWQSAINQYQLAGEGAPTSENIARVYNLWGEQFTSQQHYVDALTKYNIVLTYYGSASTGVAHAQSDTIKTYLAWGQQASLQHNYTAATIHYDSLLQLAYCTATCQSQANALDATAYYNLAESQLVAKNYSNAVSNFHIVVLRFASSPEAHELHGDYAKALFGNGKQQLNTALCSSAIPTYQQLSTQFGDTPEGQQATSALKAPQPVKGHFISSVPNDPALTPIAALMHGLNRNTSDSEFYQLLSGSPTVKIQSNGTFSFPSLKQGSYDLAWGSNRSDGAQNYISYFYNDGSPAYVATVGPLCPYDFGDINQDVPTP